VPDDQLVALGRTLRRAIDAEGAGREASQALLQLPAARLALLAGAGLEAWSDALATLAAHSVRAASAFAAAALPALPDASPQTTTSLGVAAAAVARLAQRHGGDPIVQRFAAAAGALLATRGGVVVDAWASAVEALAFGSRRVADVAGRLPDDATVTDDEL